MNIAARIAGLAFTSLVFVAAGQGASAQTRPAARTAAGRPVLVAPAPAPVPACFQPRAGDRTYQAAPLQLVAERIKDDPAKVWTGWEMWNVNSPQRTAIWQGAIRTCEGEIIVSQLINRQCSSGTECPVRVVLRDRTGDRVLLDYEQACTLHQSFQLRADLAELRACDVTYALAASRPN